MVVPFCHVIGQPGGRLRHTHVENNTTKHTWVEDKTTQGRPSRGRYDNVSSYTFAAKARPPGVMWTGGSVQRAREGRLILHCTPHLPTREKRGREKEK